MQVYEIKHKIKEYVKQYGTVPFHQWQFTNLSNWEYHLLFDIKAISENGILKNYPIVLITTKTGETTTIDLDGDLNRLQTALVDFNLKNGKETAKIEYTPRIYTNYVQAREELEKEKYAQDNIPTPVEYPKQAIIDFRKPF